MQELNCGQVILHLSSKCLWGYQNMSGKWMQFMNDREIIIFYFLQVSINNRLLFMPL